MFSYDIRRNTLTVRLMGELDQRMADTLRQELDELIEDRRIRRLVFELKQLEFMDSSGIGLILGRYRRMARRGGSVAITGQDARMDRIFEMSGLYQVVERLA